MVCANSKMYYCRLIADCFQEMYSFKFKLLKTLSYFACHLEKPSRCSLIKMQLINHLFPFWLGDRIIPWRHTIKLETDCKTKSLKPSIWAFVYLHLENVMNESKNVSIFSQYLFDIIHCILSSWICKMIFKKDIGHFLHFVYHISTLQIALRCKPLEDYFDQWFRPLIFNNQNQINVFPHWIKMESFL